MQPATKTPDQYYNAECKPLASEPHPVRKATLEDMKDEHGRRIGLRFYTHAPGGKWTPHTLNEYTDARSLATLIKTGHVWVDDPPQIMYT